MGTAPSPACIVDIAEVKARTEKGDAHDVLDAWLAARAPCVLWPSR